MRADTIQGKQNNLKTYVLKKKYQPSWLLFIQENCQSQLHSTQILFIYQNLNIIYDRYQDLGKLKSDFDTEHINIGFWINVFQFIQFFIVRIKITSYYLQYLLPPENAMIKAIDLAEFIKPEKIVYKTDSVLRNHNPKVGKNMSKVFNQDISETHGSNKMIVPIKQYSNKFLRQTAFKQNEKERTSAKQSRFTSIVNKHKVYQRKYQNVLTRKHYICKTEPNQNEYQCFTTSNNFYKPHEHPEIEKVRVKTDCIVEKHSSGIDLNIFEKEEQKQLVNFTPAQQENVTSKNKTEFPRRDQKISTSRALQLFSKIISKDKGQLLDRMKSCNQKKLIKDKIMQSSKNLQAKQIVLLQKQKKCSFVEKGQNRISLKTGLKYGKKKSNVIKLFDQNQNFEICGWDIAN